MSCSRLQVSKVKVEARHSVSKYTCPGSEVDSVSEEFFRCRNLCQTLRLCHGTIDLSDTMCSLQVTLEKQNVSLHWKDLERLLPSKSVRTKVVMYPGMNRRWMQTKLPKALAAVFCGSQQARLNRLNLSGCCPTGRKEAEAVLEIPPDQLHPQHPLQAVQGIRLPLASMWQRHVECLRPAYPTSSKSKRDWSQIDREIEVQQ